MKSILINGTGSIIPEQLVSNNQFLKAKFFNTDGSLIPNSNDIIIRKFKDITGIENRRYASDNILSSDLATEAALLAILDSGVNPEIIDGIILAHNFGNIPKNSFQTDVLPSLASRVKHNLGIKNPDCFAFDILFGCPGWVQGVILAKQYILAGEGTHYLVIGAETLSRVVDPFDRDSMIFADGAAASMISGITTEIQKGILASSTRSFTEKEAYYLHFAESNNKDFTNGIRYIKMEGRKIYEFALTQVPAAMKACLDKSGIDISEIKKVFIHQANEKMDEAIIHRFYELFGKETPYNIMPMSIHELGNSSVATVPTLIDLVLKGKKEGHEIKEGDAVIMASVGAGMNVNAIVYRF
jgi:3-oxoacyl-[acyl-carrier-protein] synthase-3